MNNVIKQSWNRVARSCRSLLRASTLVLGGALLVSQGAHADFTNGGFESGLTGWTVNIYDNRSIATFPPTKISDLDLRTATNTNTLTQVFSGTDPKTNNALTVPRVGFGTKSARVNGPLDTYRTSKISQTAKMVVGDVAADGNIHVRFAMAPVLQNPSHDQNEQPYFFVQLTNVTKGNTVLFHQFNFAGQTGVAWQSVGSIQYTDWVSYDISLAPGQVDVGDDVRLEVVGAGCSQGAHWGYVYLDQVGTAPLPGLNVSATGPAGIVLSPTSTITYTYTYTNNTGVATNVSTVNAVLPQTGNSFNTTFNAVNPNGGTCTTPAVGATGTVSCNFGTLAPGQTGTFTITVNVPTTASTTSPTNVVNHGDYTIQATGLAPVTGPLVVTNVYATAVDLNLTKTGAGAGTVSSSPSGINCGAACTTGSMTVAPNTPITLTASAQAGSTFTGWGGACAAAGTAATCTLPMSATSSVTAGFAPVTYPLTVTATGPGGVSSNPGGVSCPGDCNENFNTGTSVTLTAAPQAGAVFTGWSGGTCTGTALTCTVTMDQARSVTATFVQTFPLTVSTTGPGSVTSNPAGVSCPGDCSESYNNGTSVTLTATAPAGSVFTGWGGACSGTALTCTVTMDQARTVTAAFVPTFVVTPSVAGGSGTITPAVPSTVQGGSQVTYTLAPGPGYAAQVTGTCGGVLTGNTYTTSAVAADCSVVVTFTVILVNPVPTLSQWGMILMAALLAVMALLQLPLKNRRS